MSQEQTSIAGLEPIPGFRRVYCHDGCGAWFYAPRKKGRTRLYINATHYRREKWRREKRSALGRSGGTD